MAKEIEDVDVVCICGNKAKVIGFYIKGTANRMNYFVTCDKCNRRTNNRRNLKNAISDWNSEKFRA